MNNLPNESRKMLTIMLAFFFLLSIASFFFLNDEKLLSEKDKKTICPNCHPISDLR